MSNEVYSIAKRRVVGSPTVKAVLLFMADSASDDGSGIWLSKGNMARDLEMAKRTVQNAVLSLTEMGIVTEVGNRPCKNGFTIEYRINTKALFALPSTRAGDSPLTGAGDSPVQEVHGEGCRRFTPTRAGDSPNPPLEPSYEPPNSVREDDLFSEASPVVTPTDDRFEEFWAAYPSKGRHAKKSARAKFAAAVKRGTESQIIIDAAKVYAETDQVLRGYAKHACTWLNGECWADDENRPPQPVTSGVVRQLTEADIEAARERARRRDLSWMNDAMAAYHRSPVGGH